MIAVGVDTHKEEHVAAAVDAFGQLLGEIVVPASEEGYREFARWLDQLGEGVLVGIEGAGSYGAGLCEHLLAVGVRVVEVERPRRRDRRAGKSDRIDARLAATKVLAGEGLSTPRAGGARAALRALLVAYRSCVSERTRLLNQLQAVHVTAPVTLRERIGRGNGDQLVRRLVAMRARPGASVEETTVLAVLRGFPGVSPMAYIADRIYAERITPDLEAYMGKDGMRVEAVGSFDHLPADGHMKFLIIGEPDRLAALGSALDAVGGHAVNWVTSERTYLEVLPPGVNKGRALAFLAEHLGVTLDRVLAVGDNMNDLEMIRAAGVGVAMGSGPPALREAAGYVAPSSDEDGFAEALERFVLDGISVEEG